MIVKKTVDCRRLKLFFFKYKIKLQRFQMLIEEYLRLKFKVGTKNIKTFFRFNVFSLANLIKCDNKNHIICYCIICFRTEIIIVVKYLNKQFHILIQKYLKKKVNKSSMTVIYILVNIFYFSTYIRKSIFVHVV